MTLSATQSTVRRVLAAILALSIFTGGWIWMNQQHDVLWARAGDGALARYSADSARPVLPPIPRQTDLLQLCPAEVAAVTVVGVTVPDTLTLPRWRRAATARCVMWAGDNPDAAVNNSALAGLAKESQQAIQTQLRALSSVQTGRLDETLQKQIERLTARQEQLSTNSTIAPTQHDINVALMARGLQLNVDFSTQPATPRLVADTNTAADAIERLQRVYKLNERLGADASALKKLLPAVMIGMAALLIAAIALGRAVMPIAAIGVLCGVGALALLDLAITGNPAFRYLVVRQFFAVPGLDGWSAMLPLAALSTGGVLPALDDFLGIAFVWLPPVVLAIAWLGVAGINRFLPRASLPFDAWVNAATRWRGALFQGVMLVAIAAMLLVALGTPAALSEALILLGCVAVATYIARNALLRETQPGLEYAGLLVVGLGMVAAMGGALLRGDLGHALLALVIGGAFLWTFGGVALRISFAVVCVVGFGSLLAYVADWAPLSDWVASAVSHLPAHAEERFTAMRDPFSSAASDLARLRWLMESAGRDGWGVSNVPWLGIEPGGIAATLPLQAPSDYILSIIVAQHGYVLAVAMIGVVIAALLTAAWLGLRSALGSDGTPGMRFVAAVGGLGCLAIATKSILSAGGVLGTLPLTGLPVAFLGYGPVNLMAALVYVLAAVGAVRARIDTDAVYVVAPQVQDSSLSRMSFALVVGMGTAALAVLGWGVFTLLTRPGDTVHTATARYEAAKRVAAAITLNAEGSVVPTVTAVVLACPALPPLIAAWERHLNGASKVTSADAHPRWTINASTLLDGRDCRDTVRELSEVLNLDRNRVRLVGENNAERFYVRVDDFVTHNRWWGVPGCIRWSNGAAWTTSGKSEPSDICPSASASTAQASAADTKPIAGNISDTLIRNEIAARLVRVERQEVATTTFRGKAAAKGRDATLTLDPKIQAMADLAVRCFTGREAAANCRAVMPKDSVWAERYFGAGKVRAGAAGLVVIDVDSGEIKALAGALSDCSAATLQKSATNRANGESPALKAGSFCSQFPDQSNRWLLTQSPALWMVPPGSGLKGLVALAGVQDGTIPSSADAHWKDVLAESHDQSTVQKIALSQQATYVGLLRQLGFDGASHNLLWGINLSSIAPHQISWKVPLGAGADTLASSRVTFAEAQTMRAEKANGVNIDAKYGVEKVRDYLNARRLMDSAVGGGDLRANTVGLADAMRWLDLSRRGRIIAVSPHLLTVAPNDQPSNASASRLGDRKVAATRSNGDRVLNMLSGVTASAHKGTASGSCRVVFGSCPAQGLGDLAGKTGTADFAMGKTSPLVKPGLQFPTKMFSAVFTSGGKRYAIGTMTLRVRQGSTDYLELTSSSAAELALTLIREALPLQTN